MPNTAAERTRASMENHANPRPGECHPINAGLAVLLRTFSELHSSGEPGRPASAEPGCEAHARGRAGVGGVPDQAYGAERQRCRADAGVQEAERPTLPRGPQVRRPGND